MPINITLYFGCVDACDGDCESSGVRDGDDGCDSDSDRYGGCEGD